MADHLDKQSKRLLRILLGTIIVLVVLHIYWQLVATAVGTDNRVVTDIAHRFGLDDELSVPTWFSSMMPLLLAGLAWLVGVNQRVRAKRVAWYIMAVGGLIISIDEVSAIHELVLQSLHILANFGSQQTFLDNAWLLIAPFVLVGLVVIMRFMWKHLERDTVYRLILAVAVYFAGALVLEYLSIPMNKASLMYKVGEVTFEETLEMLGIWLAIRAILIHIDTHEPATSKKIADLVS